MGSKGLLAGQLEAPGHWGGRFWQSWDEGEVCGHQIDAAFSKESFKEFNWREVEESGEGLCNLKRKISRLWVFFFLFQFQK